MRRIVLVAAAAVAGSLLLGWWSAGLLGGIHGGVAPSTRAGREAAIGVAIGWAALLAARAAVSPIWPLAELLGGVVPVGATGLLLATIGFGAVLAGSAATLVSVLRGAPSAN